MTWIHTLEKHGLACVFALDTHLFILIIHNFPGLEIVLQDGAAGKGEQQKETKDMLNKLLMKLKKLLSRMKM